MLFFSFYIFFNIVLFFFFLLSLFLSLSLSLKKDGQTPLNMACWKGETKIVKLLLEKDDIDVNLENKVFFFFKFVNFFLIFISSLI